MQNLEDDGALQNPEQAYQRDVRLERSSLCQRYNIALNAKHKWTCTLISADTQLEGTLLTLYIYLNIYIYIYIYIQ